MTKQNSPGPTAIVHDGDRRFSQSTKLTNKERPSMMVKSGNGGRKPRMTPSEARSDHWTMLGYIALHALGGVVIGVAIGVALIVFDIGDLGTRIARAANPILPTILILAPLATLFGGAAAASAIIIMAYEKKYDDTDDSEGDGSR